MKYFLYTLILIILFIQCDNGEHFFEFDEVHHYQNAEGSFLNFEIDDDTTTYLLPDFGFYIMGEWRPPYSMNDTTFIDSLALIGFKHHILPSTEHSTLNSIYQERPIDTSSIKLTSYCWPNFTDILIFKKQEKIIGISKVCFGCSFVTILGSDKNLGSFGEHREYERLEKLLYDK